MSIFGLIWHSLPWWTWLLLVLGIAVAAFAVVQLGWAIVFAALRAFVVAAWKIAAALVAKIPPRERVALAGIAVIVVGGWVWLQRHDAAIREADKAHEDAAVAALKGQIKAANDGYVAQLRDLQAWIDGERAKSAEQAAKDKAQADAERAKRESAEAALKKARQANVTPEAARLCTLTRGVILQFNAGAASANGGDAIAVAAASAAGGFPVDSPSGVSLDTYTGAVGDTQAALHACRDQVVGWQRYYETWVKPFVATATEAVNRCTPKGMSQP